MPAPPVPCGRASDCPAGRAKPLTEMRTGRERSKLNRTKRLRKLPLIPAGHAASGAAVRESATTQPRDRRALRPGFATGLCDWGGGRAQRPTAIRPRANAAGSAPKGGGCRRQGGRRRPGSGPRRIERRRGGERRGVAGYETPPPQAPIRRPSFSPTMRTSWMAPTVRSSSMTTSAKLSVRPRRGFSMITRCAVPTCAAR